MSRTLDVRFRAQSDELPYRVLDVRFSSTRSVGTPLRTIDVRLAQRNNGVTLADTRIYEYYSRVGASTINDRMSQKAREQAYAYDLNALRKTAGEAPLLVLQDFSETEYPNEKQLQFMIRTAHAYSDVVVPPLVSRITDRLDAEAGFDKYTAFLKRALETVDTYNHKPVMGVVPLRTPFVRIEDLMKFYIKREIRAFCLDLAASKPDTSRQSLEQVLYALAKEKVLKESFLHAINVSPGRPRATKPVSPCHSILSYGYGVDSFGDLHRTRMVIENPDPKQRPVPPRLFSRKDYGDYLAVSRGSVKAVKPPRTGLDINACVGNKDLARLFNAEQHSLEAAGLPVFIKPGRGEPGIEQYLKGKLYVEKDVLKHMRALGSTLRGRRTKQNRLI